MMPSPPASSSLQTNASRVDRLKEQHRQLSQRIKDLESRQRVQGRKNDTRRKIIAGALALHHMETNGSSDFAKKMMALLDEYVTAPRERSLFGMLPLAESAAHDAAVHEKSLRAEFRG